MGGGARSGDVVGEKPGARLSCARDGQRGARPHAGLDPGRRARAPVAAFRPLLPPTDVSRPRSVSVSHGSPCLRSWCLTPMASGPDTVSHGVRMSHGVLRGYVCVFGMSDSTNHVWPEHSFLGGYRWLQIPTAPWIEKLGLFSSPWTWPGLLPGFGQENAIEGGRAIVRLLPRLPLEPSRGIWSPCQAARAGVVGREGQVPNQQLPLRGDGQDWDHLISMP